MRGRGARFLAAVFVLGTAASCRSLGGSRAAEQVAAVFEGNRAFSANELAEHVAETLADLPSDSDPRASVDDAAFDLELYYRARGFAYCEVDWSIEGSGEEKRARFEIAEGPRIRIEDIGFLDRPSGSPSEEELQALVLGPESSSASGKAFFIEEQLRAGARRVEAALRARGWLEARTSPPAIRLDAQTERVRVHIAIVAGPRYFLASLPEVEASVLAEECRKLIESKEWSDRVSKPYDPRWAVSLTGSLLYLFARSGYPDARVELTRTVEDAGAGDRSMKLACTIEPGEKVTITAIRFTGNEDTRTPYLRSRLKFEEGDVYDARAVDESVRRLYETGLFESVKTRLEDEGSERELHVEFEEADSREVFLEPGYGSYEELRLRTGVREKNVFGSGREAHAEAKVSVRAVELEVGLTDPWFLRTPLESELTFEYNRREEPSFTSSDRSVAYLFTYQPTKSKTTTFGYQFRRSDLESETVNEGSVDAAEDETDIASLRLQHRIDTLYPQWIAPTKGRFLELGLEYGAEELGSELDFLRATASLSTYREFGEIWVGAAALRGGWIRPLEAGQTIPLQERFFNGGENSVRSFEESALGPKDADGDPTGGEGFGTLNLEARRPIWGPKLQAAVFGDAGFVVTDHQDFFEPSSTETGTALGIGLRYVLPVGPVRVDLGYNPAPEEGEDDFVLHFSLGMAF